MTRVFFIRHGTSIGLEHGYKTGDYNQESAPLSLGGQKESEDFARTYAGTPSLIVSSPYVRARMTADFLIKRFPRARQEIWDDVREFNYLGRFETTEVRRQAKKEYWEAGNPFKAGSGLESFSNFLKRVNATIERIRLLDDEEVAIFSHAKFMRLISFVLANGPCDDAARAMKEFHVYPYRVRYCDILELVVDESRTVSLTDTK